MEDKKNTGGQTATGGESKPGQPVNEKTKDQPSSQKQQQGGGLTKDDLPDATNESTGKMGSGQRQDSN